VVGFLLLAASAVLLAGGAELFAEHAGAAGRRLGVSALAIGLVLAGAEPEELVTAIFASAQHHPGIAVGDAIGANITMLTLVLGLAALARPLRFAGRVRLYALAASAAGVAAALALAGGGVGRVGGGALTALYILGVAAVWWRERQPPAFGEAAELRGGAAELEAEAAELRGGATELRGEAAELGGEAAELRGGATELRGEAAELGDQEDTDVSARSSKLSEPSWYSRAYQRGTVATVLVVLGVVAMAAGGRLAVAGAERIVASLGLAESVVGLSFVALATTSELFALVWAAARRGVDELALAGVLGSAAYNATATLGVAALVRPLAVSGIAGDAWLAAALPAALVGWVLGFKRLGRVAGLVLVVIYGCYLAFTFA